MRRELITHLINWKNKTVHKPLILAGARQVGKTWLMKELGRQAFTKTAYLNFEEMPHLQSVFDADYDTKRILTSLRAASGVDITAGDTLVILDEIQCTNDGRGLTALKYFHEQIPQLHICTAGSLLGIELHRHSSFPVGKVEYLPVYPLNFREFLAATASEQLLALLRTKDWPSITAFSAQLTERLKQYYFVGGMPEAVMTFRDTGDLRAAQEVQKQILLAYEKDFSKHAPSEIVPRIRAIWNSIPSQLSKGNRKFIYGALQKSARAKDYEIALQWLVDCGLVYQVHCLATIQYPIKSVAEREVFKLFALDVGLLCAMTEMSPKTFIEGNALMTNFKGALTEQYVCQQLVSATPYGIPHYWSSSSGTAEVDFVIQKDDQIIPIEVKAEENLKSKSLKVYSEKFKPTTVIRTSLSNYREESWMVNWPLYAMGEL